MKREKLKETQKNEIQELQKYLINKIFSIRKQGLMRQKKNQKKAKKHFLTADREIEPLFNHMSSDEYVITQKIPRNWIDVSGSPKSLIKVPSDPPVSFFAAKTPLPRDVNDLFPERFRWSALDLKKSVCKISGLEETNSFHFIDVDPIDYLNINEINQAGFILHIARVDKSLPTFESNLNLIIDIIHDITSAPDYNSKAPIIISDRLGHVSTGTAIIFYIMKTLHPSFSEAFSQFSACREYGLYVPSYVKAVASLLNVPETDIPEVKRQPFLREKDQSNRSDHYNDPRVFLGANEKDPKIIDRLNSLYTDLFFKQLGYTFDNGSPLPVIRSWNPEQIDELLQNPSFITFLPHGLRTVVFLIDPNTLFVFYGQKYFKFSISSTFKPQDFPIALTAYSIRYRDRINILLTDILRFGNILFSDDISEIGEDRVNSWTFEDRLAFIWKRILPVIKIRKESPLYLYIRPYSTISPESYDILNELPREIGAEVESFLLVAKKDPPGIETAIYHRPSLYCRCECINNEHAVLYARIPRLFIIQSDLSLQNVPPKSGKGKASKTSEKEDGPFGKIYLKPVHFMSISKRESPFLDGKVVRIEVIEQKKEVKLRIAATTNGVIPSTVGEFWEILKFMKCGLKADNVLSQIDSVLRGISPEISGQSSKKERREKRSYDDRDHDRYEKKRDHGRGKRDNSRSSRNLDYELENEPSNAHENHDKKSNNKKENKNINENHDSDENQEIDENHDSDENQDADQNKDIAENNKNGSYSDSDDYDNLDIDDEESESDY